jgi:hypothetical protein
MAAENADVRAVGSALLNIAQPDGLVTSYRASLTIPSAINPDLQTLRYAHS